MTWITRRIRAWVMLLADILDARVRQGLAAQFRALESRIEAAETANRATAEVLKRLLARVNEVETHLLAELQPMLAPLATLQVVSTAADEVREDVGRAKLAMLNAVTALTNSAAVGRQELLDLASLTAMRTETIQERQEHLAALVVGRDLMQKMKASPRGPREMTPGMRQVE